MTDNGQPIPWDRRPAKAWFLAARPKTLSAAVAPVLIGLALARLSGQHIHLIYFFCALGGSVAIQIATNFINDALDFKKGTDSVERLGPLRVTQAGLLSAEAVLRGAYVCFIVAALFGVPLILRGGWPLLVIGVASMAMAYAYTGGPYPLAYHGLGEIFVLIFFGFVAVGGTYYVLTLGYGVDAALGGLAAGALAVVILAINNLRDIAGDRISRKHTMAVRIGESWTRVEIIAFALLPYVAAMLIASRLSHVAFLAVLLSLPLALAMVVRVYGSTGRELNRCLAMAGGLQWLFSLLFLAAAYA